MEPSFIIADMLLYALGEREWITGRRPWSTPNSLSRLRVQRYCWDTVIHHTYLHTNTHSYCRETYISYYRLCKHMGTLAGTLESNLKESKHTQNTQSHTYLRFSRLNTVQSFFYVQTLTRLILTLFIQTYQVISSWWTLHRKAAINSVALGDNFHIMTTKGTTMKWYIHFSCVMSDKHPKMTFCIMRS